MLCISNLITFSLHRWKETFFQSMTVIEIWLELNAWIGRTGVLGSSLNTQCNLMSWSENSRLCNGGDDL